MVDSSMKKNLGRQITHRGLESSESIYFPPCDRVESTTLKSGWGSKDKIWSWSDLLEFVFPVHASPRYHEMATKFMEFMSENLQCYDESQNLFGIVGEDISRFVKENNYSSSSFYAYCLKKLHSCGIIERRRISRARRSDSGSWMGKMVLSLSSQFATHLSLLARWSTMLSETAKQNCKKKSLQSSSIDVEPDPTESDLDEE
jgi:hypothetical protein